MKYTYYITDNKSYVRLIRVDKYDNIEEKGYVDGELRDEPWRPCRWFDLNKFPMYKHTTEAEIMLEML